LCRWWSRILVWAVDGFGFWSEQAMESDSGLSSRWIRILVWAGDGVGFWSESDLAWRILSTRSGCSSTSQCAACDTCETAKLQLGCDAELHEFWLFVCFLVNWIKNELPCVDQPGKLSR
jgi:hypothetical protein